MGEKGKDCFKTTTNRMMSSHRVIAKSFFPILEIHKSPLTPL
jgi:hypothetical protein